MALSTHWEWRGFGTISDRFRRRFETLEPAFGEQAAQKIVDEYLWIPASDVNLKFREGTGTQDGHKFKRLNEIRGKFEKWTESPDEIFPFPLSAQAWRLLQEEIGIPFEPPVDANRDETVRFLQSVEPRTQTVVVRKRRRASLWDESRSVKVELAEIETPSPTMSVGLEVWDSPLSVAVLTKAVTDLELDKEPLEVMNYLEYIRRCVD